MKRRRRQNRAYTSFRPQAGAGVTVHVGTSGYNYEAWRGSFYPEDLSSKKMLAYYAERFDTVEINYSFYRKPTPKILEGWAAQVPERFRFALKAWQRITHQKRLRETEEMVSSFADAARALGPRLAPVLYQLPPNLKADVALLRDFLHQLPRDLNAAFEFRHASWFSDETYSALHDAGAALCVAESDELATPHGAHRRLRVLTFTPPRLRRHGAGEMGGLRQSVSGRRLRVLQARGRSARPGVCQSIPAAPEGLGHLACRTMEPECQ